MSRTSIRVKREWDGRVDPDAGYEYALVQGISEMTLIPVERWSAVDLSECLEARIFGADAELHLFREEDKMMSVITRDLPDGKELSGDDAASPAGGGSAESAFAVPGEAADIETTVCSFATIDRTHRIRSNCRKAVSGFNEIVIREYIAYDGDGQAYTARTRLTGLL